MPVKSRVEPYGADPRPLNSHELDVPQVSPTLGYHNSGAERENLRSCVSKMSISSVPDPLERFEKWSGLEGLMSSVRYQRSQCIHLFWSSQVEYRTNSFGALFQELTNDLFPPDREIDAFSVVPLEVIAVQVFESGIDLERNTQIISDLFP
jgi:hypothetical protein